MHCKGARRGIRRRRVSVGGAEPRSAREDLSAPVHAVEETSEGAYVWLEFVSLQAPGYGPDGETCTYWSLDYELVWYGGWLLIDRVTGHGDSSGHTSCE
ncbi:hypothetical protein G1H11_05645 [Phytoactinopolyspora alkaliphila]|uniref:Uncharacterized protein n=1 Tax=Phytoactinopolyspora alkaliphila TaxID=1783498 RepID=A0A6N9YIQ0_9ACTN|nr:hypothetical protein [Phytoactinopolyspora alkaliphila]NED94790.1 hypothetical protein [Phytoactinopolyspora alkaliphila]